MPRHGHAKADARNLYLHRLALAKLERHPALIGRVLASIDRWLGENERHPARTELLQWRTMLESWPLDRVAKCVLHEEDGQTLRQCSPLAGVLAPQERWEALRRVRSMLDANSGPNRTATE